MTTDIHELFLFLVHIKELYSQFMNQSISPKFLLSKKKKKKKKKINIKKEERKKFFNNINNIKNKVNIKIININVKKRKKGMVIDYVKLLNSETKEKLKKYLSHLPLINKTQIK